MYAKFLPSKIQLSVPFLKKNDSISLDLKLAV